eukprot:scaffold317156_cov36-Prasinocladus_malaysianus.AAC.1
MSSKLSDRRLHEHYVTTERNTCDASAITTAGSSAPRPAGAPGTCRPFRSPRSCPEPRPSA